MLSVRDLGFAHAGRPVFSAWSAEFEPGVTWVVGDDGSGKTTLLLLIAGVLDGRGTVSLGGVVLGRSAARPIAWCDARDESFDALAVGAFVDRFRASAPAFDEDVLQRHIAGFELTPHLGKAMFQLSTGTRRKFGLAACFAMRAPVLLLDDPTAALDGPSVAHLMQTLADADRDPSRVCLVSTYAAPAGATRTVTLPPRP